MMKSWRFGMAELDLMIGKRLQTARKALGFKSARSFARHHGIPESTYSQHETGKRSLNPTTMITYCKRLKIKPGWLVTGDPNSNIDCNVLRATLFSEISKIVKPELHTNLNIILDHYLAKQETEIMATIE